ncbi:MAG: Rrf2 family transcriptional regulator [Planctomycetaceae bacterium]|nr:Rrf2 family transcriptional regulator [Planctomycetaceae bacterium]
MLSQTVEYALRAMVCLAAADPHPQTRSELVEQTRVPSAYLAKVMRELGRRHLVEAQRGRHGGFRLSRPAGEISLLHVVDAVEPLQRIRTCPLEIDWHGTSLCPLHRRLDDILLTAEQALASCTLADIVRERSGSIPLCREQPLVELS